MRTYQSSNTPTLCQFHDDPNPRSLHQTPIILDYIHIPPSRCIHQLLKQCNFLLDISDIIIFCIEIDDFESYDMA